MRLVVLAVQAIDGDEHVSCRDTASARRALFHHADCVIHEAVEGVRILQSVVVAFDLECGLVEPGIVAASLEEAEEGVAAIDELFAEDTPELWHDLAGADDGGVGGAGVAEDGGVEALGLGVGVGAGEHRGDHVEENLNADKTEECVVDDGPDGLVVEPVVVVAVAEDGESEREQRLGNGRHGEDGGAVNDVTSEGEANEDDDADEKHGKHVSRSLGESFGKNVEIVVETNEIEDARVDEERVDGVEKDQCPRCLRVVFQIRRELVTIHADDVRRRGHEVEACAEREADGQVGHKFTPPPRRFGDGLEDGAADCAGELCAESLGAGDCAGDEDTESDDVRDDEEDHDDNKCDGAGADWGEGEEAERILLESEFPRAARRRFAQDEMPDVDVVVEVVDEEIDRDGAGRGVDPQGHDFIEELGGVHATLGRGEEDGVAVATRVVAAETFLLPGAECGSGVGEGSSGGGRESGCRSGSENI